MPRYLTQEWFDEVNAAAERTETGAGGGGDGASGGTLTMQQVVTGGPDGDVRFVVRVTNGRLTMEPGEAADADATLREDYATAAAIAAGDLTPEDALLAGRIRVSGRVGALIEHQEELTEMRDALSSVRARTTF